MLADKIGAKAAWTYKGKSRSGPTFKPYEKDFRQRAQAYGCDGHQGQLGGRNRFKANVQNRGFVKPGVARRDFDRKDFNFRGGTLVKSGETPFST